MKAKLRLNDIKILGKKDYTESIAKINTFIKYAEGKQAKVFFAFPPLAEIQYKKNHDFGLVPRLLGAQNDTGVDFYFAATKLYLAGFLGRNVLVTTTVRATKANQFGLLGFGGDRNNSYRPEFEGSAAVFLNDQIAIGAEFRTRPDNLLAFEENDIHDVFLAYVPNKHCALTVAYSDLGRIADKNDQDALYLSALISF